jgi:predicted AAA+ superfamily ATPase
MERFIFKDLIEWKNSDVRKPLVIRGVRQVGKTWLMIEFGKKYFKNYVYFNFDEFIQLKDIFIDSKNPSMIIEKLKLISGSNILPNQTLIIFDEIQECSEALNSLKYFNENANEYFIIAAGSFLGILLSTPHSYPVGQIDIIDISPLSFEEFLLATDPILFNYFQKINKSFQIDSLSHSKLLDSYHNYLIIGGMPEVVNSWVTKHDPNRIEKIQNDLISLYEADFTKHNGSINSSKILLIFRNIVSQLAKENKKFVYGVIKEGARAREYAGAIDWLVSASVVHKVYLSNENKYPIKAFDSLNSFKLYLFDTGILKQMAGVTNESIILDYDFQFKGALAENFIYSELKNQFKVTPRYFTFGRFETDFLIQNGEKIVPVEVKSSEHISSPSSINYKENFNPEIFIRYSSLNLKKDGTTLNIPLYLVGKTKELI